MDLQCLGASISPLATVFRSSSMSKLPDADRKPFPNPSGQHHCKSKIVPPKILKNLCSTELGDKILFVHGDAEQWFYKITDFANLTDYQHVQRRPVVIASPTTGAETTDALTFLYLTRKPFIFINESNLLKDEKWICNAEGLR